MVTTEDGVYEGTVQLQVELSESVRQVVQFMGALRRNAEFRLLQVAANYREFEISLQLRSPVRMKEILLQMDGVSQVDPVRRLEQDSDGAWFKVQLARSQPPARRSHA